MPVTLRKRTVNAFLSSGPEHDPSDSTAVPPPAKRTKRPLPKQRPAAAATVTRQHDEKLKLTDLPVEVIIQVLAAAEDPNDMQSLAATCKALHAIFRSNLQYIFNLSTASYLSTKLAIMQCFLGVESPSFLSRVQLLCNSDITVVRKNHVSLKTLGRKCSRNEKVLSEFADFLYRADKPPWYNLGNRQPWNEQRMRNALNRLWALQVLFYDRDGEYFGDMIVRSAPASWEVQRDPQLGIEWTEICTYVHKIMYSHMGSEISSYPPAVRTILEFYIENFLLNDNSSRYGVESHVEEKMRDVEAVVTSIFMAFNKARKYAYINGRQFSICGGRTNSEITCGMILLNGGLARFLQIVKLDTDTLMDNIGFCVTPYAGKNHTFFFRHAFGYLHDLVVNVAKEKANISMIDDDNTGMGGGGGNAEMDGDVQMGDA